VSQALANLVGNAVQHGAEATPIVITARGAADAAVIAVVNRGEVIAGEDQQQIFNPFEKLSSAATTGSGSLSEIRSSRCAQTNRISPRPRIASLVPDLGNGEVRLPLTPAHAERSG
jgi:hypothetical protein